MIPTLSQSDALIIVDMQNDFCPGGALPVRECDRVVATLNRWIEAAVNAQALVVASRDWHPSDHSSFQRQGGKWPIHCVQDSYGAQIRSDLSLPADTIIVNKGTQRNRDSYSAFDQTGLANTLRQKGINRVWIGGVALDVCVQATALDAVHARFTVHLICDGTSPVDVADGQAALQTMQQAGVTLERE